MNKFQTEIRLAGKTAFPDATITGIGSMSIACVFMLIGIVLRPGVIEIEREEKLGKIGSDLKDNNSGKTRMVRHYG